MLKLLQSAKVIAPLLTIILLGATFLYWQAAERETAKNRIAALTSAQTQITAAVQARLSRIELVLQAAKGLYEGSDDVSREEFHSFAQALRLDQSLPGLQGLSVLSHVTSGDRRTHAEAMRASGFEPYQIWPPGDRADYAPIVRIEPYSGINTKAIGFDVQSNPAASPALAQSRDSGLAVLSSRLTMAQDTHESPASVVMYLPIYAPGAKVSTLPARRAALTGWVSAPFRLADLMNGLAGQIDTAVGIAIYDGDAISSSALLYDSTLGNVPGEALQARRVIDIGARHWTLVMHPLPTFDSRFKSNQNGQIAALGAALSLSLGALILILGTDRDRALSAARVMTRDLRNAQNDMEGLLDALPDVLSELDLDGRFHKYRTSSKRLLIRPAELFLGKLLPEVLPAQASAICMAALHEANASGFSTGRQIQVPVGSELRWFELSVSRRNESPTNDPRFVMISRDITKRKQFELQLERSNDQLRLLEVCVSNLNDIVLITEAEPFNEPGPRIVFVNDAFVRLTGYTREEVLGQTPRFLQGPKTQRDELDRMGAAFRQWLPVRAELINYTKSGQEFWLELDIVPVKDASGWYTHWVAVERDITDRKLSEQTLVAAHRELLRSNAELEQFAYVASHDLQEPLRSVSSCVQLLKLRYAGALDARADEFIDHAVDGAARMQALIDDLLAFSRLGAESRAFAMVDTAAILQDVCDSLALAVAESHAQISHDALPCIHADASQLAQLFQNLLSNALKFRDGKPAVVHVGANLVGNDWIFSVADQGIGIAPQYHARIFGLFKRLHSRTEYAGTGIGLAICKKIVEHHEGRIWVESQPGRGTTFFFTLAATDPAPVPESAPIRIETP